MPGLHNPVVLSLENSSLSRRHLAVADFLAGIQLWRLWATLGWSDILQRYRRSILGPLWLTASMGIMVLTLGVLYGQLFKQDLSTFMPFFCAGLLVWSLISSLLNEAGALFVSQEFFIKQIRLPYTIYAWKFVWARVVIFAHNFIIYIGVMFYFRIWPGGAILGAILAFAVIVLNGFLLSTCLGMVSARFRDVPQIIAALTQVVFFLTPILWQREFLGQHAYIVDWNPFYHFIELMRSPLLGSWPTRTTVLVVTLITILNMVGFTMFFSRFRSRIAYWV